MLKKDVRIGGTYSALVSGQLTTVRVVGENGRGGWVAVNLATNRTVRVRSAQRLRGPASSQSEPAAPAAPAVPAAPSRAASPKQVPIGSDGLEGWTSCCGAAVTFAGATLCCKACWHEVEPVLLDGERGDALSAIVRAVIADEISGAEGAKRQLALLGA